MEKIAEKLANLITVKSIVTILLSLVYCYCVMTHIIDGSSFKEIFLMIIAFYFGTQAEKNKNNENDIA